MDPNNVKVRMIIEMVWLRPILEKYFPSLRGLSVEDIPKEMTMTDLIMESGSSPEDIQKMTQEAMASMAAFNEKTKEEAYEFGPDVDLSDDHYLWGSEEEKEKCVRSIEKRYTGRTGEIVFYGPSNITLWYSLEKDMEPYQAQNHGMGGCTDEDLIHYADRLLYPFKPKAVFFQSGSNDLTYGMTAEEIVENKRKMYSLFLEKLPKTELVIMSGLPLPGRKAYWKDTDRINHFLKEYAESHPRPHYMDATEVMTKEAGEDTYKTYDGRYFIPEYFRLDQIHLNKRGHDVWTNRIKETLNALSID